MTAKARAALQSILADFPETKAAEEAKRLLDEMDK
jgi:TolA-binding protein